MIIERKVTMAMSSFCLFLLLLLFCQYEEKFCFLTKPDTYHKQWCNILVWNYILYDSVCLCVSAGGIFWGQ